MTWLGERPSVVRRLLMQVVWPAFIGAALTTGVVFSLIDPAPVDPALLDHGLVDHGQIQSVGDVLQGSREAAYTIGFMMFWVLHAVTGGLVWYLMRGGDNRSA